ncbi:MAG: hypothetical protein HEP70_15625 [Rhodobiaceae bacterium]|nr:hypothetical protein [Rhodobiaceae bacterium]
MRFSGFAGVLALLIMASTSAWSADRVTGTGTIIENQTFGSVKHWGRSLNVRDQGTIVRVMGGTYGFQIRDMNDNVVGDFLFPDDAVGFDLQAGDYKIFPLTCRTHLHHHVEVTVEY